MTDQLKEIFETKFDTIRPISPEYSELWDKEIKFMDTLRPILGTETVDKIDDLYVDIAYQTNYEWFCEGFRLGASLMLELL